MELLRQLGIEPQIVAAQAFSFIVLMLLLWRFLFKPVGSIMRQRQEQIANSLAGADAQQTKAESLRKEYQSKLDDIADEARAKLDQAMKDTEAARQRQLESTQAEIREMQKRHESQMALDREQLRRELRAEMSDIAVMAAGKALRMRLTPDMQSAVIDQVISELDRQQVNLSSPARGNGQN